MTLKVLCRKHKAAVEEKLNEMKRKSLMEQKYVKDESSALRQMEEKVGSPDIVCADI